MKKNTIKAFTLVEMLIVIVIIGILIAALMPRMQSAQGRARDVARKNDLSQIQTAIVTSQQDKGVWPGMNGALDNSGAKLTSDKATDGMGVDEISKLLLTAGMNAVPKDPLSSNQVSGLGSGSISAGQYGYMVATRNGTPKGGFVLMAKTEIEGGSNYIYCTSGNVGKITSSTDLSKDVHICTSLTKNETAGSACVINTDGTCTYTADDQLRYILVY